MRNMAYGIIGIGLLVAAAALGAPPVRPAAGLAAKLPEPINTISCNIADLEATGFFSITKVGFGRTRALNEAAVLWTVKVVEPLTCRHAIFLLRHLGDARFYRTLKDGSRSELMSAELYYPAWITDGAISSQNLPQDSEFSVWLLLDGTQVRSLKLHEADTLEFSRLRR